jgi:peptide/nickel transport system permease protein
VTTLNVSTDADEAVASVRVLPTAPSFSQRYRRYWRAILSSAILLLFVAIGVLAPIIAPRDPNRVNVLDRLTPPTWQEGGESAYPLGTDQLGRDLLSRIIYGVRSSFIIGFLSVVFSAFCGSVLGIVAGYYSGHVDNIIMRIVDIQMAIPFILLALLVVAMMGPSTPNIIIVFTVTSWYIYARVLRASVLSLRTCVYVEAARALGASDVRILALHILPSLTSPLMVVASFEIARIITTEAALGFLGMSVPPPDTSWGSIISDGREYIQDAWWISTLPGAALVVTVISVNVLGDALRDILDPRLRV